MDLQIREVRPDDAEAIVRIFNPIIETGEYTAFDTPFTVEAEREYILNFPKRGIFHVAVNCQDKKVVGFQGITPFQLSSNTHAFDHVGILGTYVDLSYRRQGVATCLFEFTFEVAKRKGYEKIFTFISADNLAALAAYLKNGFYIGKYVDEIIVERFL